MTNRAFHIGAQNDALYIIYGEAPAMNNDYPNHEADRTPIAKVYPEHEALARALIESSCESAGYPPTDDELRELSRLRVNVKALTDDIRRAHDEIAQLKAEKFRRFNEDDCWVYMEGAENHLESLVCPVVISPKKLIELGG